MEHKKEYKICYGTMKCKYYHPEIGCISEYENKPYPQECYRNKAVGKELLKELLETGKDMGKEMYKEEKDEVEMALLFDSRADAAMYNDNNNLNCKVICVSLQVEKAKRSKP